MICLFAGTRPSAALVRALHACGVGRIEFDQIDSAWQMGFFEYEVTISGESLDSPMMIVVNIMRCECAMMQRPCSAPSCFTAELGPASRPARAAPQRFLECCKSGERS